MTYQEAVKELKAGNKIRNNSIHIKGAYIFLDEDCEITCYNPNKNIIESYSNEWLSIKEVSPNDWEVYNDVTNINKYQEKIAYYEKALERMAELYAGKRTDVEYNCKLILKECDLNDLYTMELQRKAIELIL